MTEVQNYTLPSGKERLMCEDCLIVDIYELNQPFKCNRCGNTTFQRSSDFDDEWIAHQKNTQTLAEAEELVSVLKHEIEKFNNGWFSTWNSYQPEQLNFATPTIIDTQDFFSS